MKPFKKGDEVVKFDGAYGGPGVVKSSFEVKPGEWRIVVAHKIEGGFGELLHIYGAKQLRFKKPKEPEPPPPQIAGQLAEFDLLSDDALVDINAVMKFYGRSRASINRDIVDRTIPQPMHINRAVRWRVGDLRAHVRKRKR